MDGYTNLDKCPFCFGPLDTIQRIEYRRHITLLLSMDFIPFPSETQFPGFIRCIHLDLFPKLLNQGQFNQRARNLRLIVEQLRRYWLSELGATQQKCFLLNTNSRLCYTKIMSGLHSENDPKMEDMQIRLLCETPAWRKLELLA